MEIYLFIFGVFDLAFVGGNSEPVMFFFPLLPFGWNSDEPVTCTSLGRTPREPLGRDEIR